jgi:uncharacterized membrane protein
MKLPFNLNLPSKQKDFLKNNILLVLLVLFSVVVLAVNIKINLFKYNNFEFGKFDLGNMTQMVWNTTQGRVLWLTDYFGTNLPRWAMSHVDPILLLFVPIFLVFPHPLTLVFSQLVLIIGGAVLVYLIADQELKSKYAAFFLGISYLLYPAVGFLTSMTGFHGVSAVIPFFLGAFYVYEKMHKENNFSRRRMAIFWLMLILTMTGKEQVPLYIAVYGAFILFFRNNLRTGLQMMAVGFLWFFMAFFVIIPHYSKYRIEGFNRFADSLGINTESARDVSRPNYFLSRYEGFGDSYGEVMLNILIRPEQVVNVFFGGDRVENFQRTFEPLAYLPFAYPTVLVIALPDFLINYLTTASGIGTSEISNHRISMIIPVLFISVIFAIGYISGLFEQLWRRTRTKKKLNRNHFILTISFLVLSLNLYTSYAYENPVYLWFTHSIQKRLTFIANAKSVPDLLKKDLKVGRTYGVSPLENKDRECAAQIVGLIPEQASVSGPDFMGAHLSMRETYAIFPALYNEADFVIVDVFARKIVTILDINLDIIQDVVFDMIRTEDYKMVTGCGNLFVFEKTPNTEKDQMLPLQERFRYEEKFDYHISQSLTIVDYDLPAEFERGENRQVTLVYTKRENNSLTDFYSFLSFVNKETAEVYQVASLPSYGIKPLGEWDKGNYYIERDEVVIPKHVEPGEYMVFTGISNRSKTSSVYLGDVLIR